MSRIPIKYKLTGVKLKGGSYTSDFQVDIRYRIPGGSFTSSHTNVNVSKHGEILDEVMLTGLSDKTTYELEVTSLVPNGNVYTETFKTHDNMTLGESPIYLKQIYRGQQLTLYYNPPPNGVDINLDTDKSVSLHLEPSDSVMKYDWYYPFITNTSEVNQSWLSFILNEPNNPGPVFLNKTNLNNPSVSTSGKYFNGLNYLEHDRPTTNHAGWISAGEMFNDRGGDGEGAFITIGFYIDPVNSNVTLMKVGGGTDAQSFTVKWDDTNKKIVIDNRGESTLTIEESATGQIEYSKWYTLRLSFRESGSLPTEIPGQRTVVGVYAYLYTVDDSTNLGKCVGKSFDNTMSLTWANEVVEVGSGSDLGYVSEPMSFGKEDGTTLGLTLTRIYHGADLPNDVLDTVGSLDSSNKAIINDPANANTVKRIYINMLRIINFHRSSLGLVFTNSETSGGAELPAFSPYSYLKMGSPYLTGGFPKATLTNSAHMTVKLTYTVTTDYTSQGDLDADFLIRANYASYEWNTSDDPREPFIQDLSTLSLSGGTAQFDFDCSSVGNAGYSGRVSFDLILVRGFVSEDISVEFSTIEFIPTSTVGVIPTDQSNNVTTPFSTHLGAVTADTLITTGEGAHSRNTELTNFNDTSGGTAQINLTSMGDSVAINRYILNNKWVGNIKAAAFTCTIPPAPNKYEALSQDPNTFTDDAVASIINTEGETIPKGDFVMGLEVEGLTTSDDSSIEVGFDSFVHPKTESVEVLDPEDWIHDSFDINFNSPTTGSYETEKDKFYSNNDTIHTQWGGYNGGVSGENFYFDETDPSLIVECHGDHYPEDGDVKGVKKGPKDYNFKGYGEESPLYDTGEYPDPNYALSSDKIMRTRTGAVLLTKKYCTYGSFLISMKLPKGLIGVSPALWFFHYIEIYPTDPRWDWWIRQGVNTYSTNYLVVNNEIDMELPSHTTMYHYSAISEVSGGYWDPLALDSEYRIGVTADPNPDNNGTWKLSSGNWTSDGVTTEVSDPYDPNSWEHESKYLQERLNPDMSNVKFNNWIGEKSGGYGWGPTKQDYTGRTSTGDIPVSGEGGPIYGGEEYLAKMTELSKDYADGEYHDWDIKWFPDRTELWVDGEFVRENRAFVPFNLMKYTYGLWFPSNKLAKLESGQLDWATDRGSWGGRKAEYEVAHMNINRIAYRRFTDAEIADGDGRGIDGGDPQKIRAFSESYPEAGVRSLSRD